MMQQAGARPADAARPLWRHHCLHSGVLFPASYAARGLTLERKRRGAKGVPHVRGEGLRLSPEAEEFALEFGRLVHARDAWATGNALFRANFWRDWCALLGPGVSSGCGSSGLADWDWAGLWKGAGAAAARPVASPGGTPGADAGGGEGSAWIDGVKHAMTGNGAVDRPGIFRGRGADHPLNGRIRRRLGPADVELNLSRGAPVPLPRWTDGGTGGGGGGARGRTQSWGAVVHEPLVSWLARWKDPLTGLVKYVTLDHGAEQVQRRERLKFDMARRLSAHLPRVRARLLEDATTGGGGVGSRGARAGVGSRGAGVDEVDACLVDPPRLHTGHTGRGRQEETRQVALCACVIEAFGIRAGEGGKSDGRSLGATSLRVRNVEVPDGGRGGNGLVRLRFLGKDQVCFDAARPMGEAVAHRLAMLGRGRARDARLFPLVEPPLLNRYLDCLLPGLTSKVMRTRSAGAALEARFSGLARAGARRGGDAVSRLPPQLARDLVLTLGMMEAAAICNHRRAVGRDAGRCRGVSDAHETQDLERSFAAALDGAWAAACVLVRGGGGASRTPDEAAVVHRYQELELRAKIADVRRIARRLRLAPDTAKINYVDPRIVYRFCEKWGVPTQAVYTRGQLRRFAWALPTGAS